jgi:hypothetical protein
MIGRHNPETSMRIGLQFNGRRLLHDNRGTIMVLVAITLPVLLGFIGFGVEAGLWYTIKRHNQSASDVAALSGAFEVLATNTYSDICGFAKRDAVRSGFVFASYTCPASSPACTAPASGKMCANNPPVLGPNAGKTNYVEVILAQQQNTFFASLFLPSVTINTRAVAAVSVLDQACLLALDPTASNAIFVKGNPTLNMPNCSIVADSNSPNAIHFQGSANVTADTVVSHGGITQTGGAATITLNLPAETYAPIVPDPYASTLTHSFLVNNTNSSYRMPTSGTCTLTGSTYSGNCVISGSTIQSAGSSITLSDRTQISGGLDINHQTINLSPGTYWITDGDLTLDTLGVLECTACNPATGAGITIILTTAKASGGQVGTVTGKAGATVGNPPTAPNFNAPGSGPFQDLLIIQDSNALPTGTTFTSTTSQFQGGPSTVLDGLVYFPKSQMTFNGNPSVGTTGCLLVVTDTITLSGDSKVNSTGCNGPASPPTVKTVALTE